MAADHRHDPATPEPAGPPAPRAPLPPWWAYDELLAAPPGDLTPLELPGAAENDCDEEAPDVG